MPISLDTPIRMRRQFRIMQLFIVLFGAYLTAPHPTIVTTGFLGLGSLIFMVLAARAYAKLTKLRTPAHHETYIFAAAGFWAISRFTEHLGWLPDIIALLQAVSVGFLALFTATIPFNALLIILHHRKRPPSNLLRVPEPQLLGM